MNLFKASTSLIFFGVGVNLLILFNWLWLERKFLSRLLACLQTNLRALQFELAAFAGVVTTLFRFFFNLRI